MSDGDGPIEADGTTAALTRDALVRVAPSSARAVVADWRMNSSPKD